MTLFTAFAVVAVTLCLVAARAQPWPLWLAAVLASAYWGGSDLLSRAKPVRLALVERMADTAIVVGSHYVEGEAIWLWLILPGEAAPRAYSLPWSQEAAERLQRARRQAEADGTHVEWQMPFTEPSQPDFEAALPREMPEKG